MIKFFRNIRKRLLSDPPESAISVRAGSKFSKYLLYAIGEIILVVIGILIALQINNKNEFRKERVEEQKILIQLEEEYKKNLDQLDEKIYMRNKMTEASNKLLEYIDNPITIHDDSLLYYIFRITQEPTYDPIENDLIASGKLRLIEDDSLSNMLSKWSTEVYQVQEIELSWQQIRNESFLPLLVKNGVVRSMASYLLSSGYVPDHALDKGEVISYSITKNNLDVKDFISKNKLQLEGIASTCILYNKITNSQSYALRKRINIILDLIKNETI